MMRSRWAFRNVSDPISNAPGTLLDDGSKCLVELFRRASADDDQLAVERLCSLLRRLGDLFSIGVLWIEDHPDRGGLRRQIAQQFEALDVERVGSVGNAGGIAAGPGEARDDTRCDRVAAGAKDQRHVARDRIDRGAQQIRGPVSHDHFRLESQQLGNERRNALVFAFGPTIFDPDVLPVFEPLLLEALKEGRDIKLILTDRRRAVHKPDERHGRFLPRRSGARLAQPRPRERGKPEGGDDIAPPHAIASPARPKPIKVLFLRAPLEPTGTCGA